MALNLSPEQGVKLTKKDRERILKKLKKGWKSTVFLPDYGFDENGDIQVMSDKHKRAVRITKMLDDGIYVEKALKSKTFRVPWSMISYVQPTKKFKDSIELSLTDGKKVYLSLWNSYKIQQNTQFILDFINQKRLSNNSNVEMYN